MLIKEFRVLLPLTTEEYQVGQLYSVAKKSELETSNGEGVEVVKNEPYEDEKSKGQYTEKIYHLGSRLPGWAKAFIPGNALKLEEKAWNAYPYCKTVLRSPWMGDSFTFIIESRHENDDGKQENVLNVPPELLKKREVEFINIADKLEDKKAYKKEEDPTLVRSEKANRGPLTEGWQEQKPLMCCYKLVTAEFKMFGFQGKVESFLMKFERDLFFNFHRQVYCWLDQWFGMTMDDIREIETKTKKDLEEKLKEGEKKEGDDKKDEKKDDKKDEKKEKDDKKDEKKEKDDKKDDKKEKDDKKDEKEKK